MSASSSAPTRSWRRGGRRRLYAVYPYDGLSIADSPLGYVDNGDAEKEQAFLDLQEYLLSDEVQNEIQRTGRRTGYEGVSAENADVFRADWGIQPDRVLSPIRMPSPMCSWSVWICTRRSFASLPSPYIVWTTPEVWREQAGSRWWRP